MAPTHDADLQPDEMTAMMRALGDPRRYSIVKELAAANAPVPCCSLAQTGQVSPSTMSHHIQQLEQSGLIEVTREGRFAVLRLNRARYEGLLKQLVGDAAPRSPNGKSATT